MFAIVGHPVIGGTGSCQASTHIQILLSKLETITDFIFIAWAGLSEVRGFWLSRQTRVGDSCEFWPDEPPSVIVQN